MGWQLNPPPEGDREKIPQITRAFTPSLDIFPKEYTTTTLSVDDLVNRAKETAQLLDGISQVLQRNARAAHSEGDLQGLDGLWAC